MYNIIRNYCFAGGNGKKIGTNFFVILYEVKNKILSKEIKKQKQAKQIIIIIFTTAHSA